MNNSVPLSPIFHAIRSCTACPLHAACRGPVPGHGNINARVMLVGEAPGEGEDESGLPFRGRAGQYLDYLLDYIGLLRSSVFVTNTVKCRPSNNRDPVQEEVSACRGWLDAEIDMIDPTLIVLMGQVACKVFLGPDVVMEHCHGRPYLWDRFSPIYPGINPMPAGGYDEDGWSSESVVVLPVYHPAAGLHQTRLMRPIMEDFGVIQQLVNGKNPNDMWPRDNVGTNYQVAGGIDQISRVIDQGTIALDTETMGSGLWSVQISAGPGTGLFIPADLWRIWERDVGHYPHLVIVHNYLYDSSFLSPPPAVYADTMVAAYLLSLPQGLKELAFRLCGMDMESYQEMVHTVSRDTVIRWLSTAMAGQWPDPVAYPSYDWDASKGEMVTKTRKPKHIMTKIRMAMKKAGQPNEDPVKYWSTIDPRERRDVESALGPIPTASLADVDFDQAVYYACRDADATGRVWSVLDRLIEDQGLGTVFWSMEIPLQVSVRHMMDAGMGVDVGHFSATSEMFMQGMKSSHAALKSVIGGTSINPNSSAQVANLVYNQLGFTPTKMTDGGAISTDDQELKKVDHPSIVHILEYRRLAKMKDAFCDPVLQHARARHGFSLPRISSTIRTTRGDTGRLTMSEPLNLQAQPIRYEEGLVVRNGYIPEPGNILVSADYSQIEMRVMAHVSQCARMLDVFRRGGDVHTENASAMFGVSMQDAAQDRYRYPTKKLGFGVIFEIGEEGLHAQMQELGIDWTVDQCRQFISDYYHLHPEIRTYQTKMHSQVAKTGQVTDIFGRIRLLPEAMTPMRGLRQEGYRRSSNSPIQMAAQGIIKLAMAKVFPTLPDFDAILLLQIHDSLDFELPVGKSSDFCTTVKNIMEAATQLSVPIVVDIKTGYRWGSLRKQAKAGDVDT